MDSFTLLIVDDVPANLRFLQEILADYTVHTALSGEEALTLAREHVPDLILLDIIMPGMDGFEVCRRLKAESVTQDIPVVFCTGMGEVDDETKGLEVGAVDYIIRPLRPPIVRARVRTHLELKHQRDLLRTMAMIDGLTGIASRHRFHEAFEQGWRRCLRSHETLSVLITDIDHFKAYNDHYGHVAGDHCLKEVAERVRQQVLRPCDVLARFGGEEFVCVLPDTDLEGAVNVAERIRAAVDAALLPHAASLTAGHVTVSIGVATAQPTPERRKEDLLLLADRMLYRAKLNGRNRVESAAL